MKKKLLNGNQALCLSCQGTGVVQDVRGYLGCQRCGRMMLIDRKTKEVFVPEYAVSKTYQASPYTPSLPCRRKKSVRMPILKERRRSYGVLAHSGY